MISREEVLQLAELARLKLDDKEVEGLQKDISGILEYVGQISAVAPQGATSPQAGEDAPLSAASFGSRNVMREDVPRAEGDGMSGKEEALRTAFPKKENNYNVVRKIIQKDE